MLKLSASLPLLSGLFLALIPVTAQAQSINCSQYKEFGPRAVGACIDLQIRQRQQFGREITRDINNNGVPADIPCGIYKVGGPRTVGACIDAKLDRQRQIDRSVANELNQIRFDSRGYRQQNYQSVPNYYPRDYRYDNYNSTPNSNSRYVECSRIVNNRCFINY